ncbi:hypothetical protein [Synoicihabitans lomoniglobus]|uniref:Uncharacterized protein n=1 Tax=Synoicihabitans lomoniglobus TaxID=2909285 RepID=A0AAE9ZXJ8_9BACT|nr:hypothetical protein [Opitutaceae bacterium LMO-M01]WED64964.1 hypothetical protein PXH66_21665 [Opitutaceae bacterium LMO-M01]
MKRSPWLIILSLMWAVVASAQPGGTEEEEPTVIGVEIARGAAGFLGLAIEGNAFVLRFYDAEKAEINADAARAVVSWNAVQKAGRQRVVLTGGGSALRSPPRVLRPYAFIAYLSLITEDGEAIESHAVNMRQFEPITESQ